MKFPRRTRHMANAMALLDDLLNHRLRLARSLPPYDVITVTDDTGEIEVGGVDFLRHRETPVAGQNRTKIALAQKSRMASDRSLSRIVGYG